MKKNELIKALHAFGFTDQQARLYLAGLQLGSCLMTNLAREAGIKRSTAYYAIGELERRGFFNTKKVGGRTHYVATSPQKLLTMTAQRLTMVKKLFPQLDTIRKK